MIKNKTKQTFSKSLVVAGFLTVAPLAAHALSTDYYATSSRLATGHWVKVRVTNEGMQQITYDELRSWGFSNPENVKVYGYGGSLLSDHIFSTAKPDDVQPTLSLHTDDGRLIFFGDAEVRTQLTGTDSNKNQLYTVYRNYASTAGYYLLTDAEVGGSTPEAVGYKTTAATTTDEHLSIALYEKEAEALGEQSCIFHTQKYNGGETIETNFAIRDYAAGDNNYGTYSVEVPILNTTVWATYTLGAATCSALTLTTTQQCKVDTSYNGDLNYNVGTGRSRVTPADGEETIADGVYTFSSLIPANDKLSYVALDRAVLIYPRKNVLHGEDGSLLMNFLKVTSGTNFTVEGATPTTHVWNVSSPGSVFEHTGLYDADNSTFTGTFDRTYSNTSTAGMCRLIAFDAAQQQQSVQYVGEIDNQDIHADATPDMLIITTDELLNYAEQLAAAHRKYDGIDVNVYTQAQIFNEFGSGTPSTMAIRRAIKMFYDRDKSKLKSVLMYGKACADFRQISTNPSYDPLITFEVEPVTSDMISAASNAHLNFASDDYFGCLKDTDTATALTSASSTVDVAVGRIPAGNAGFASDVNKKLINYMQQEVPADVMMNALLVSDNGDSNQHFNQSLNVQSILKSGKPAITTHQGHCLIYPHTSSSSEALRSVITEKLQQGMGLFCYNGHGAEIGFASEYIWTTSLVGSTAYTYAPVAMLSTCNSSCFDRSTVGIADDMLQQNNGGMIGLVASARSVLLDANTLISEGFINAYAAASGTVTLGSLYATAHNTAIKNSQRLQERLNTWCYNLCGDPAIKIRFPEKNVTITSVNNESVLSNDDDETLTPVTFLPETTVNVKAYVANALGEVDTNYNGTAIVKIYEAPLEVSTILVDSKDVSATVDLDETVLATAAAKVVNGEIDASVYVPINTYPASESRTNRIVIVTEDADGVRASGVNTLAYVDNSTESDETVTVEGPQFSDIYVDKPEYTDGAVVGSTSPTVYANISLGAAGLCTTNKLGANTTVALDGVTKAEASHAFTLGTDNDATFQYTFSDLTEGTHTVTITVSDNAGNSTTQSITFTVQEIDGDIELAADSKSVYESVTFDVNHTFYGEPDTRFVIEDSQRNTVLSVENASFPYVWDLKDSDGKQVTNGYYRAYILAKYGTKNASSDKVEVVVLAK